MVVWGRAAGRGESGSVALELVLLVPVMVLLALFVLWAGRGGRAALTADLAAEEAATAAAYCCEDGDRGEAAREAFTEDFLAARPGLGFLCVGGLRPGAPGGAGFVDEGWVEFAPGRSTGGVGVLGVRFLCESDGAVAPLRGLFPTVTFHGQAAEVVLREAEPVVGFKQTRFTATEGSGAELVFKVRSVPARPDSVTITYVVRTEGTTAEVEDFVGVVDFANLAAGTNLTGTVTVGEGLDSAQFSVPLVDDGFYEGPEDLVLEITGAVQNIPADPDNPTVLALDEDQKVATGRIFDDDPEPHVFLHRTGACEVVEGGAVTFEVRLRDPANNIGAPSASAVTVEVDTFDGTATAGVDYTALVDTTLTFAPGTSGDPVISVTVQTLDDAAPVGERDETFRVVLSNAVGAPLGSVSEATCEILDDEVRVTAADVGVDEGDVLIFKLSLDRDPTADITVEYELVDHNGAAHGARRGAAPCDVGDGDDYLELSGTVTIASGHDHSMAVPLPAVTTCEDALVEHDETFWLEISIPRCGDPPPVGCVDGGEAVVEPGEGAVGTVRDDDVPVVSIVADPESATGIEGQSDPLEFTVSLKVDGRPAQLMQDVTVDYEIGGTPSTATKPGLDGADYAVTLNTASPKALSGTTLEGTLTFKPAAGGEEAVTEHLFEAELLADDVVEEAETFVLDLDNLVDPVGAAVFADTDADPDTDDSQVEATITDDAPPSLTVNSVTGAENTTAVFTVTLAGPRGEEVTVPYSIVEGTATAPGHQTLPADFEPVSPASLTGATLTFGPAATDTEATVSVRLLPDTINDPDESFRLELGAPTGAVRADSDPVAAGDQFYGVGTITNVAAPALTVDSVTGAEDTTVTFTVTLAGSRGEVVTVPYSIVGGTGAGEATAPDHETLPADFEPVAPASLTGATLTFGPAATDTEATVSVRLLPDTINDPVETFRLELGAPTGAVRADSDPVAAGDQFYGVGTITNVDGPVLFAGNATAREGETLTFTVTLCSPVPGEAVTVKYQTQARSAKAGRDFTAVSEQTLTFPADMDTESGSGACGAGVTTDTKTLTVDVTTLNDRVEESDEEVHLVLSAPAPAHVGLGKAIGVGRIVNVGAATVRVSDPTAIEGSPLVFRISLEDSDGNDATITAPVTVYYATEDRTAAAGADYTPVPAAPGPCLSDTPIPADCPFVTFEENRATDTDPPVREYDVSVPTTEDLIDEDDETVALRLRLPAGTANAGLGDAEGTGTIEDADPPALTIRDEIGQEGETMTFSVVLLDSGGIRQPTSRVVTVLATTEDGTATAPGDYTPASRRMTIPVGLSRTENFFTVEAVSDDELELPETFRVVLSDATNARVDRAVATGTITEDCWRYDPDDPDAPVPAITASDAEVQEGNIRSSNFYLSFSTPLCSTTPITMTAVFNRTATITDFEESSSITIQVRPDLTLRPLSHRWGVMVRDDALDEDEEQYEVHVSYAAPELQDEPAGVGVVTIIDDDPEPSLRIADASALEGEALRFVVSLDAPSGRAVNVQYRTVQRTGAHAATGVDDYVPVSDWTPVAFTPTIQPTTLGGTGVPGQTEAAIVVPTVSDGVTEGDETLLVELREPPDSSTPMNARLHDNVAVGTILAGSGPSLSIFDASGGEGETMRFRVALSQAQTQPVTVSYTTVERRGAAVASEGDDGDYRRAAEMLTFAPGDTEHFAEVAVHSDGIDEGDETFLMELSGQSPATVSLADPSAVGTIIGSVACVDHTVISAAALPPSTVRPGSANEGAGRLEFSVVIDPPLCSPASVTVQPNPRGATVLSSTAALIGVDLELDCSGVIPSRQTELTCEASLVDDDLVEGDESIYVTVVHTVGQEPDIWLVVSEVQVAGIIVDNDLASLSVADASGPEGGFLNFVLRLGQPSGRSVTVDYATGDASPVSAVAGADYRARSGTATIAAGELSAAVSVFAPQDRLDENDETFLLELSNPTGGASVAAADAVATGTITDDDPEPVVAVSDASAGEGDALVFAVTLDAPSGREVTVARVTRDGTARSADSDYEPLAAGDVVFAAGETRQTVRVQTLADSVAEGVETVFLDLESPRGATLGDRIGRGDIRDVSDRRVSVSDASVIEGGTLAFVVGFSEGPSSRDVILQYRTRAGTATAGVDYDDGFESATQELRIVAGATSATVDVPTVNDVLDEDNESFELVLSDPQGAVIVDGAAAGVIIDNDPLPALRVSDTDATEAEGASAVFTLTLSAASGRDVTVTYSTDDATATAGADYTAKAAEQTVIAAGDRSATVDVALLNDDVAERVETFQLVVSAAANASRDDSVGVATITDDDGLVQIQVEGPGTVFEGAGASAVFTVRLSRAATAAVTVVYSTADGTAAAGADYTAAASQTLTFASGETTRTVTVALLDDDVVEQSETFRLVLSSPSSNAELGDDVTATVLVIDDDGLPTLSAADAATRTEGPAATASFTITLSRSVPQEVTVDYATLIDPTAAAEAAATPGQDYTTTSGTATIAARATQTTVTVPLLGDSLDEHTETFWLRLSNPAGATIVDGTATGTIADDDPLAELSIADAGATEGSTLSFEVRLTPFSGRTVTVPWTTETLTAGTGAASPGTDYTPASGTVILTPGNTTARLEVASLPDTVSEADEQFLVQLGAPANAALDDSTAVGSIRDDDGLPRVSIADTTTSEDDSPAIFTVTLSHASSQPVTVAYTTADGTATNPDDYAPDDYAPDEERTLTIPAAFTTGEISVFIVDDDTTEGTETFTITLTEPVNAVIAAGAGTAVGTIRDDEGRPRASIAAATATEGDAAIEFDVTLSHASTEATSVRYTTFDGTATQPGDYTATTGTVTIAANTTAATAAVTLTDDTFVEDPETLLVRIHDPDGIEIATAEAIGVILDDDDLPVLNIARHPAVREDVGTISVEVTLSRPSDTEVSVDYYTDFLVPASCPIHGPLSGPLVFPPGTVSRTIDIEIVNDPELCSHNFLGRKSFWLRLRDPRNAEIHFFGSSPIIYIWDLQRLPCVRSMAYLKVAESAGVAVFMMGLARISDEDVTLIVETRPNDYWFPTRPSATAGADYTALSSHTVTVPAGTLRAPVNVALIDDSVTEPVEVFQVAVTSASGADNSCGSGTLAARQYAWILDDDSTRALSVADVVVPEAGTAVFIVSLDEHTFTDVTVDYTTLDGTAVQPGDYVETSGTVRIPAGLMQAVVEVPLVDDADAESDEAFTLRLSGAVGASITDAEATATIHDNDSDLPVVHIVYYDKDRRISDPLTDGETVEVSETRGALFLLALLDEPATLPVTVTRTVLEVPNLGEEAAALRPYPDFDGYRTPRPVTIQPGGTLAEFPISVYEDQIPEHDERFLVVFHEFENATLDLGHIWIEITDNDLPVVSVGDVTADEDAGAVVFNVQLHAAAVHPASVRYMTVPLSSAGDAAATPGSDYTSVSGVLRIPAGASSATISVPVINDSVDEAEERFLLVFSEPDLLSLSDSVAVGAITDDDPGFWIDDRSVWENAGSMVFTVQRDHTSTADVTVNYRIGSGGSAVGGTACTADGTDFVTPSGTVTMPAAATEAAISVQICNDDDSEGREILLIELTSVTGRKTTGVGTIVDND